MAKAAASNTKSLVIVAFLHLRLRPDKAGGQ
jgi:hypothetical protein